MSHFNLIRLLAYIFAIALLTACTSSGSSSGGISLSGTLSNGTSSIHRQVDRYAQTVRKVSALNFTGYTVECATLSTPPQKGSASVNSDGSFSVSIAGATGQPMSCYLDNASGDKVADFIIDDTSHHDMDGNDSVTNTAAFNGNASLGTLTYDPNAGEIAIPATTIANVADTSTSTTATVFDPTGSWTIADVDFSLPPGILGPCSGSGCQGPPLGVGIYLKLWQGTANSDGSNVYGLQVWQGDTAFGGSTTALQAAQNCGGGQVVTGLSSTQETNIGASFSNNGSADTAFSFASSVTISGSPVSLTNNWELANATTSYQMCPCGPDQVSVNGTTYQGYRCGPDMTTNPNPTFQISLGGGCVDASNNPVNVTNWSSITSCSSSHSGGLVSNTCTGTFSGKAVSCTSTWITATNTNGSSYPISSDVLDTTGTLNFNYSNLTCTAAGTSCSAVSDPLQQVQCYANAYYQNNLSQVVASCLPKLSTDWTATTAANFVKLDFRPTALVFEDQYRPYPDGSGGSLTTRQEQYRGVQAGANNFIDCHVIESDAISVRKVNDTKLLATFQTSQVTTDTDKPACMANFTGTRQSYMFYLTK